jgi:uncharacterized cupin superfamily protein
LRRRGRDTRRRSALVPEARLEPTDAGLTPVTEGWFVVNVRDAAWVTNDVLGDACTIEADGTPEFEQLGFTIAVLRPGQAGGRYHGESNQEDFLVLAGECILIVEEEERRLRAWDFVHCPPNTLHGFVGAGDGPCVIFMTGARTAEKKILYPRSELALEHGLGVETETTSPGDAYSTHPKWKPGPPSSWAGLPWE